jgi:anaerobic ribonucleoside-triphosphate reductase activating protein
MNYFKHDIVFQEIPGEISLSLSITGCRLQCEGCHSPELWSPRNGQRLSVPILNDLLQRYSGSISCVLFMGGEWEPTNLIEFLTLVRTRGLKTALYTGRELEELPSELVCHLDFLKTGPWKKNLGGLNSPNTNQKFIIYTHAKEATCL